MPIDLSNLRNLLGFLQKPSSPEKNTPEKNAPAAQQTDGLTAARIALNNATAEQLIRQLENLKSIIREKNYAGETWEESWQGADLDIVNQVIQSMQDSLADKNAPIPFDIASLDKAIESVIKSLEKAGLVVSVQKYTAALEALKIAVMYTRHSSDLSTLEIAASELMLMPIHWEMLAIQRRLKDLMQRRDRIMKISEQAERTNSPVLQNYLSQAKMLRVQIDAASNDLRNLSAEKVSLENQIATLKNNIGILDYAELTRQLNRIKESINTIMTQTMERIKASQQRAREALVMAQDYARQMRDILPVNTQAILDEMDNELGYYEESMNDPNNNIDPLDLSDLMDQPTNEPVEIEGDIFI